MTMTPTLYEEKLVKARKQHKCAECISPIVKGERYYYVKGLWEGRFDSFKFHKDCHDFRQMITPTYQRNWDDYIAFGMLFEAIEYVFEDTNFLDQWKDEEGDWLIDSNTITEMKLKYEFMQL